MVKKIPDPVGHSILKEPTLKDIPALGIFSVYPPREIQQLLVKNPAEKNEVARVVRLFLPPVFSVNFKNPPGSPGMNRGIGLAEGPLVSRQVAVRMHVPNLCHELQLMFR